MSMITLSKTSPAVITTSDLAPNTDSTSIIVHMYMYSILKTSIYHDITIIVWKARLIKVSTILIIMIQAFFYSIAGAPYNQPTYILTFAWLHYIV